MKKWRLYLVKHRLFFYFFYDFLFTILLILADRICGADIFSYTNRIEFCFDLFLVLWFGLVGSIFIYESLVKKAIKKGVITKEELHR